MSWRTPESDTSAHLGGGHRAQVVCVFASTLPFLMLAAVLLLRGGFPTPTIPLFRMAGLSLLILNVAGFGSRRRWYLSGPILTLLALVTVPAIGLVLGGNLRAANILALAGVVAYLWNLAAVFRSLGTLRVLALLSLSLLVALYAGGMYWHWGTAHDILYPEAVIVGQINTDVVEQAAVVNMISTYRIATTGVDGLLPLKYHNGSLWMEQGFRRLCGFQALDFVAFGIGLLLVPLYVAAFFGGAELVRSVIRNESGSLTTTFWAAAVVGFVGLFPFEPDPVFLNFNKTIINSDSYILSIAMGLLLIAVATCFWRSRIAGEPAMSLVEKLGACLALPVILGLIGFVKISSMYLLVGAAAYLCWRLKSLRSWPFLAGTVVSIALLGWMLHSEVGANKTGFAPLRFDRVPPEWIPYFFVLHFAWVWILLVLWARIHGIQTLADAVRAVRARESILVEVVGVIALAGLAPYLLLDFNSPAWKFFTDVHGVIAAVFVAALLPDLRLAESLQRFRNGRLRLTSLLAMGLALAIAGHLLITTFGAVYRVLKRNGEIRAALAGRPVAAWRLELRQVRSRTHDTSDSLAARLEIIKCLHDIGRQPAELRKVEAIYIPKTNRVYWDMRQVGQGSTPFIAPAVAGVAMVEGLPEYEDIGWAAIGWGYPQYKLATKPEPPADRTSEATEKARAEGFQELIILENASPEGCQLRTTKLIPKAGL